MVNTQPDPQASAENLDILTVGCDANIPKRNKLKGTAMQKLIILAIGGKDDLSIKSIIEKVSEKAVEYFIVEAPFKIGEKVYRTKYEFVHVGEFPEQFTVETRHKIVDKKWKVCSKCGQYIPAAAQKTRKCRKCREGFFRYKTVIKQNFEPLASGKREEVLEKLVQENHLKRVSNLSKRADFFEYKDEVFYIFESKNKELTGLQFVDIARSLIYPLLLRQCGYAVSDLEIIFNGSFSDELHEAVIEGYAKKYNFNIRFRHIRHFLQDKGVVCKGVRVKYKAGERYVYEIVEGTSEQMTIWIEDPSIAPAPPMVGSTADPSEQ